MTRKPQILFVDDEQRVLNSMRIMFRRLYDMHLASSGGEALEIAGRHDIDVIVADHRMPLMTGVELLSEMRILSPGTVRILLTGYADLDAVEGSINDGEVFRFLTKPCAPDQLRSTLSLAVEAARRPQQALAPLPELTPERTPESAPAAVATPTPEPIVQSPRAISGRGLGIIAFTSDEELLTTVQRAVAGKLPVYAASNVVKVIRILAEHQPGVLVTDISDDKQTLQTLTARLKEHLPELVTVVVSPHRDVQDMVWLINHGQIFRFLRKPLSTGRCAVSLQAALKHHCLLQKNPVLARRHQVDACEDNTGVVSSLVMKIRNLGLFRAQA